MIWHYTRVWPGTHTHDGAWTITTNRRSFAAMVALNDWGVRIRVEWPEFESLMYAVFAQVGPLQIAFRWSVQ